MQRRMKLEGKITAITGAASGIGRAMALAFVREGARVLVCDLDSAGGEETVALCRAAGGEAEFLPVNVTLVADTQCMVETAVARWGRLDILLANAGIGVAGRITDTSEADFDRVVAVNVKGAFLTAKAAVVQMLQQGGGKIVFTASVAGLVGVRERLAYTTSKGAVIGLMKAMAVDHARDNIRINAICPGTIETPWVARINQHLGDYETIRAQMNARQAIGRMGTPEEVAGAAVYICSPEADFMHGTCFVIDGGFTVQ